MTGKIISECNSSLNERTKKNIKFLMNNNYFSLLKVTPFHFCIKIFRKLCKKDLPNKFKFKVKNLTDTPAYIGITERF